MIIEFVFRTISLIRVFQRTNHIAFPNASYNLYTYLGVARPYLTCALFSLRSKRKFAILSRHCPVTLEGCLLYDYLLLFCICTLHPTHPPSPVVSLVPRSNVTQLRVDYILYFFNLYKKII